MAATARDPTVKAENVAAEAFVLTIDDRSSKRGSSTFRLKYTIEDIPITKADMTKIMLSC